MSENSELSQIRSENRGGVLILTLDRPEKKNAITSQMYRDLTSLLNSAAGDFAVRVVIITAESEIFTAGNDIFDFLNSPAQDESAPGFQFLASLHEFPKPLIAAVEGNAVGIGTTLLLHCDLVYASLTAKFQMPFVTLGLVPEAGSSVLFPRLVGHAKASEIFLTGRSFGAQEALDMGLINQISDAPLTTALEVAAIISEQPPTSVINTKALLKSKDHMAISQVMAAEGELFRIALESDEAQSAFMNFMEKRKG
jgi:enoyl-CoA hydratase/carnithine racemase